MLRIKTGLNNLIGRGQTSVKIICMNIAQSKHICVWEIVCHNLPNTNVFGKFGMFSISFVTMVLGNKSLSMGKPVYSTLTLCHTYKEHASVG